MPLEPESEMLGLDPQTYLGIGVPTAQQLADAFQFGPTPQGDEVITPFATLGPYDFSSPSTRFYMDYSVSQSQSGNYSNINLTIRCYNGPSGSTGSQYSGSGNQSGSVDGVGTGPSHSATPFLPSGYSANQLRWSESGTEKVTHNSDGIHSNVTVRSHIAYGSINQDNTASVALPRIPKVPDKVATPSATGATVSSMSVAWTAPDNNGASITGYDIQYDDNSSFSSPTTKTDTASPLSITGLADATTYWVRVRAKNSVGAGAYSSADSLATIPAAPTGVTLSEPSTTGMKVSWVAPGPVITGYEVDYSTSSTFASGVTTVTVGNVLTTNLTGLVPGTTYYVRVRAKNASGEGVSSATANQSTLPSVPPGLTIVASPDGKQATLTFTPPGGVSGVTKYTWERRPTAPPQTPVVTGDSTTAVAVVTGLTPGNQYDWRGSAWIGSYQSPWTAWTTVQQPKPNTNPGDYFDGSTPDTPDEDYGWTGTVNNSTSTVTAKSVLGWGAAFSNGATGVMYQITGGWDRDHAARVLFHTNATAEGAVLAGMGTEANVAGGATYFGSIYADPDVTQSLAAVLTFYDAFAAVVGTFVGPATEAIEGEWTRLVVSAESPVNAARATVRITDVAGPSWHLWLGGNGVNMDAAMITLGELFPYFDGETPDTSTYTYDWEGATDNSESTRTAVTVSTTDPLADPDCPPVPLPPRPPAVPADCIDEIGVWRRYWATISAEEISDWLAVIPTITIQTGAEEARQVRIRIYENPDNLPAVEFQGSEWISEQIVSYMPPDTLITLDGVSQRTWAEVGGGNSLPADKLLYGTGGTPASWPILSCGIGYLLAFDAPLEGATGNIEVGLSLTERAG